MTFLSSPSRYVGVAVLTWVCLWAVLAATLPLFPVDETRYLTVAWEMRHSGDYLLPTLNGAPYSHKPPLLFWLVNILWSVTGGPSIWAARIVPLTASLATLGLTMLLARRMFAGRNNVAPLAGLVFMACPVFMLYGVMIMFDFMQAVFVLLAMVAAWDAYDRGRFRSWLLVGLAMGLGVLAKGPVILVHVLPVMILFPLVMRGQWAGPSLKRWYGGIAVAVLIAAAIGLAWAIPAAVYGGPEFSRMIFWEQSAGRMTKAFAHRRPFWFYIPTLIALILPLILWRPFWTAARKAIAARRDPAVAFLLCWAVPVFVIFSLISGKQPHYLIPMIPAIAILAGRFIADEERVGMWNLTCILPAVLAFVAIGVAQYVPAHHTVDN